MIFKRLEKKTFRLFAGILLFIAISTSIYYALSMSQLTEVLSFGKTTLGTWKGFGMFAQSFILAFVGVGAVLWSVFALSDEKWREAPLVE